jgi:glyoxylase-like metal-dependent hydrolase (beta-lactamase superfamily II)
MSNIYLLEYENGFLMLDCGLRTDIGRIEAYFRAIGRSPADIKLLVVTHLHPDHAGSAVVNCAKNTASLWPLLPISTGGMPARAGPYSI